MLRKKYYWRRGKMTDNLWENMAIYTRLMIGSPLWMMPKDQRLWKWKVLSWVSEC